MKAKLFVSPDHTISALQAGRVTLADLKDPANRFLLTMSTALLVPAASADPLFLELQAAVGATASPVPEEYKEIAEMHPEQYAAFVAAFVKANSERRVLKMRDVDYSQVDIVR